MNNGVAHSIKNLRHWFLSSFWDVHDRLFPYLHWRGVLGTLCSQWEGWLCGGRRKWGGRKWTTCTSNRGFDLRPGLLPIDSIHSKLGCLWGTTTFCLSSSSSQALLGVTSTYKPGRIQMQISFFSIWEQVSAGKCSSQTEPFVCDFPVFLSFLDMSRDR